MEGHAPPHTTRVAVATMRGRAGLLNRPARTQTAHLNAWTACLASAEGDEPFLGLPGSSLRTDSGNIAGALATQRIIAY